MTDFLTRLKALTELERLRNAELRHEQSVARNSQDGGRTGGSGDAAPAARMSLTSLPLDSYPVRGLSDRREDGLTWHYRDDLDHESVRLLALHARQQLSIQALSIANAQALDVIGLFREQPKIRLM